MSDTRRITLVSRRLDVPSRAWDLSAEAHNRIIFVKVFGMVRYALDHASQDVDRVLIDRTASPAEFLDLLIALPSDFLGDVLLIRDDDTCFLSTTGRAGGRLLYSMTAIDLQFYLATTGLVIQPAANGQLRTLDLTPQPSPCYL